MFRFGFISFLKNVFVPEPEPEAAFFLQVWNQTD